MNKEKNFCIKFFSNGSVYIGEIKSDKLCGHGKFLNVQGDIIVGFFNDNCFHGYNIIERSQNNSKFEGQFEKNKFNGYGLEQFADGSNYYGQYKNNEKWGIGTYSWGDKYQYQGEWKYGRPNGVGIFIDDKNKNAIINSKSKEETFGDNNLLINSNDIKNIKSNEINELSLEKPKIISPLIFMNFP